MWRLFQYCCGPSNKSETEQIKINLLSPPTNKKISSQNTPEITLTKKEISSQWSIRSKQNRYQGQSMNGVPHGNGSMLYANGDFYRGEWVNGKKSGHGLQIYQEQNVQYEGQWQNGQPHGNGKMLYQNSSYYNGQFSKGVKDGKGQYYDFQKKKLYNEYYENGSIKQKNQIKLSGSKQEEFPTLALDKERFNTDDLNEYQNKNAEIKQFDVFYFLQYYGLCKLINLEFINKSVKEWTIKEVKDFLVIIGLGAYRETFYNNKVKGKDLITLSEQQLKEDLKMKLGDRRRMKNYITFIFELQDNKAKSERMNKKSKQSNKMNYRIKSHFNSTNKSMNFKKPALYQQSIQQESQSEDSDPGFKSTQKIINNIEPDMYPSEERYISAAIEQRHMLKSPEDIYSEKQQVESERSSNSAAKSPKAMRKSSRDYDHHENQFQGSNSILHNNLNQTQKQKKDMNFMLQNIHSLEQLKQERKSDSNCSSSTSSQDDHKDELKQLQRKKTVDKSHHHSQIRELYDFLKEHQNLYFLIKERDIQKLQQIGEGGYGKVFKGKYAGSEIAIKYYEKTRNIRHKQDFMKQLQIISDLKHPNIVLYMGICITANKYALITEYLNNGSLFDQIHKKKTQFTPEKQIQMAYDIVKGMVYLHNIRKTLHRDLKSSNVLIGQDWKLKLCDFGLSGQKKKLKKSKNRIGTYQWMAPEVIRNEDRIDEHSDVYSFGVIIWEMLTEKIPYEGLAQNQIIGLVGHDPTHELEEPPQGCPFLKQIMRKCLKKQMDDRPSFIEIYNQFDDHLAIQKQRHNNINYAE